MLIIRTAQPSDADEWLRMRLALWPDAEPAEQAGEIAAYFTNPYPPLPDIDTLVSIEVLFLCG